MEHEFKEGNLLDNEGNLIEPGFAYSMKRVYSRDQVKVNKLKIKEWDYYYFGDDRFGVAVTIADNGYMGLVSAHVIGFRKPFYLNKAKIFWFPLGKTKLPESSNDGSVKKHGRGYTASFENENGKRHIKVFIKNFVRHFDFTEDFNCDFVIEETTPHSMVIATPFDKKGHFYYNQKKNLLKLVSGSFCVGDFDYTFKENTYGVLDWGRGVWTYKNTWYWSSLNAYQNGHSIGFNFGYGFGNTKAASENMLFYDDKVYKFEDVKFEIPKRFGKTHFMGTWKVTSKTGDINLTFKPIVDRHDHTNAIIISQNAHQVFGKFSGTFKTKDGVIEIKDLIGFAEKVKNRW